MLPGGVLLHHLRRAGEQEHQRIAGVPLPEEGQLRLEGLQLGEPGDLGQLRRGEPREEGNVAECLGRRSLAHRRLARSSRSDFSPRFCPSSFSNAGASSSATKA